MLETFVEDADLELLDELLAASLDVLPVLFGGPTADVATLVKGVEPAHDPNSNKCMLIPFPTKMLTTKLLGKKIMFIGRENEIQILHERFDFDSFELGVIYGKKRMGENVLNHRNLKRNRYLYLLARVDGCQNVLLYLGGDFQKFSRFPLVPSFNAFDDFFIALFLLPQDIFILFIEEFAFLAKSHPVIRNDNQWNRKANYYVITDPFIRFYYRLICPYLPDIEREIGKAVSEASGAIIDDIIYHGFEDVVNAYMDEANAGNRLGAVYHGFKNYSAANSKLGRDVEIDGFAESIDGTRLLAIEDKYKNKDISLEILDHLKESVSIFAERYERVDYYLFSKKGFFQDIMTVHDSRVHLISLDEMVGND